jgi:hypothetical protein
VLAKVALIALDVLDVPPPDAELKQQTNIPVGSEFHLIFSFGLTIMPLSLSLALPSPTTTVTDEQP